MGHLPTAAELEAILSWQKAHVFEGRTVRMEPIHRQLPTYKAVGRPEPSVLDVKWQPSLDATTAYLEAHWECESRGEARRALRRQEMERLAQVAEAALAVRPEMSLITKAALGSIVSIGTGRA